MVYFETNIGLKVIKVILNKSYKILDFIKRNEKDFRNS